MDECSYKQLIESTCKTADSLQENFKLKYNLDFGENWFYDAKVRLLTFSDKNKEINFNYLDIGSYNTEKGTWMWSWYNNSTTKNVKEGIEKVKQFGIDNNLSELTEGYFETDENFGWRMSSLSLKILGGIGFYRPVSENLMLFFILTDFVPLEEAMLLKQKSEKLIECRNHDFERIAYVCQHLNKTDQKGFHESFEYDENEEIDLEDDYSAWCDDCEKVKLQHNGWNDESMKFANIKLTCKLCFFEMKKVNERQKKNKWFNIFNKNN